MDRQNQLLSAGISADSEAATRAPAATAQELSAEKERAFQQWYVPLANRLKINPNPDDPGHKYDYRAFHADMTAGKPGVISPDKPGGHFPSDYKTEGHPRTYLNDPSSGKLFDTRSGQYVAGGQVPDRALTASERSPDTGLDAGKVGFLKDLLALPRFR